MIPLRCHKCGHTWEYTGRSNYRTTCPKCKITVYLDKCMIPADQYKAQKIAKLQKELRDLLTETEKDISSVDEGQ